MRTIKKSFDAAKSTYDGHSKSDPTNGATHWVSPKGLENKPRSGYYKRTYQGITTYFPDWARSNEWVKKNPEDSKKWFDVATYKEYTVSGVSGKEFLFYKGVKYNK